MSSLLPKIEVKRKRLSKSQKQTRALAAAIACSSASGLAFGITLTLVRTNLFDLGMSEFQLGVFGSFIGVLGLMTAFAIPTLARRMGTRTYLLGACVTQIFSFFIMLSASSIWDWIIADAIRAFSALLIFGLSEAWVTELAPPKIRARIMSIYTSFWAGSMAVGAAIPPLLGYDNVIAQIAGILTASCAFLAVFFSPQAPTPPSKSESRPSAMLRHFRFLPLAFICVVANGAYESITLAFLHIYGEQIGMSREIAGGLVVSATVGMVILLPIIGIVTDKIGWYRMLQFCILTTLVSPFLIIFAGTAWPAAYLGAFLAGGTALGFYVIALVQVGESFKVEQLASANALVMICYTIGASVGPFSAGAATKIVGPSGTMIILSVISVGFALAWAITHLTKSKKELSIRG